MIQLLRGDFFTKIKTIRSKSVHCIITSPPYWGLRRYNLDHHAKHEMGQEDCIESHVGNMVLVLRELRRILRDDGTLWLVLGDTYTDDRKFGKNSNRQTGLPRKSILLMPSRIAVAALRDGWTVRQEIIAYNPTAAPNGDVDRPSTSHQTVYMMSKTDRYYYDRIGSAEKATGVCRLRNKAEKHPGREEQLVRGNARLHESMQMAVDVRRLRSVWVVPINKSPKDLPPATSHHARFTLNLPVKILTAAVSAMGCCATCQSQYERIVTKRKRIVEGVPTVCYDTDGWRKTCQCRTREIVRPTVCDSFAGSGTTLVAAQRADCNAIGIELNPTYAREAQAWLRNDRRRKTTMKKTIPK